jgi:hypothetical protein
MGKYTTIKVSKETLRRLHKLVGELTQQRGERVSLEDAIIKILNEHNREKEINGKREEEIEKDREQLISLLQKKVEGAGPEDYLEYDF